MSTPVPGSPEWLALIREPIMDPDTGKQKIGWIPRPQIGCATNAAAGAWRAG